MAAGAATETGRAIQAWRLPPGARLVLDGTLSHPAWQLAPVHDQFSEKSPDTGTVPDQTTQVQVLFDDLALYLGIQALDDQPALIRAPLVRHDGVNRTQDFVVVDIDVIGLRQSAQFFVSMRLAAWPVACRPPPTTAKTLRLTSISTPQPPAMPVAVPRCCASRFHRCALPRRRMKAPSPGAWARRQSAGTVLYLGASRSHDSLAPGIHRRNEALVELQVDADELRRAWWRPCHAGRAGVSQLRGVHGTVGHSTTA